VQVEQPRRSLHGALSGGLTAVQAVCSALLLLLLTLLVMQHLATCTMTSVSRIAASVHVAAFFASHHHLQSCIVAALR